MTATEQAAKARELAAAAKAVIAKAYTMESNAEVEGLADELAALESALAALASLPQEPASQEAVRWLVGGPGEPLSEAATWSHYPTLEELSTIGHEVLITPLYATQPPAASVKQSHRRTDMTAINELIDAVLTAHPFHAHMRGLAIEARKELENPGASQAAKAREFGWQLVEDYRDAEQAWSSAVHEKHSTPEIRAEYQKARDALNEFFERAALASLPQEPASQEAGRKLAPLTDEQIDSLNYIEVVREDYEVFSLDQKSVRDFAREVIVEFCRINGITAPEDE